MKSKSQPQISLFNELIVDNFAGGGGASTGIELATGRPVDIAINHDPSAILMHRANHPYTQHFCENVWEIDPRKVCRGQQVGLAWFSPDCKHFSKAKGGKPRNKNIRGLAWVAVKWAATVHPRVIMLENVEEFQTWCPLDKDGQPELWQKGRTFNCFVHALEYQGYHVEYRELRACDYGAPTIRKRFFLIARCDGRPIVWPEPTHGAPDSSKVKTRKLKPWRTAAEIIDWNLPCPSIFDSTAEIKEKYGVQAVRPLADNTMKRIARGIQKFVLDNPEPFIVNYKFSNDPESTGKPLSTITAVNSHYLVSPLVTKFQQNSIGQEPKEPLDTVMAGAARFGIVAPVMTAIGQNGFSDDRSYGADQPVRTIVSKAEQCLVTPMLVQYHGETQDGEVRGQQVDDVLRTVDASNRYALTCAFMSKYYGGGYHGKGNEPADPLNTVTSADHNAVVTSHLIQLNNHCIGQPLTEPINTVTAGPGHFGEVRAFLMKYYGTGEGQQADKPLGTVTARDRFGLVTIHGENYAIVDIGLRMLTPRELYAAQGFPADYIIDTDCEGNAYPKSEQVARCGNAVPPPFAKALVTANLPELCIKGSDTMAEFNSVAAV